ncbi:MULTISPECIES: DUF4249 domain-containing protein [unclassified Bacteroides]|uniref:DUF4249 domain-containing protein n=1 Tax=unclassified Bacteroides TaxID=2646097 RepID=UPI0004E0CAEA|nr:MULTISPECIES: DUF4249 domain-containing protein [unclassified Bacteroides]
MKRHIYILALAIASLLAVSCDKEIGTVDFNEQPRLIINSLMTANDTANFVELHLTGNTETKPVKGAQVRIFVNGSLSEEVTSQSSTYMIKSQFESGDKVKIEAKADKYEASAEVVVPDTVEVLSIDSVEVVMYDKYHYAQHFMRYFIRIKDLSALSEMKYYRLSVTQEVTTVGAYGVREGVVEQVSYYNKDLYHKYSYSSDIALSEGEIKKENNFEDVDDIDMVENVYNYYGLFRSSYFKNGEYTLAIDIKSPYYRSEGYAENIQFEIRSIPRSEYFYLQAITSFQNYEEGYALSPTPIVPSNVNGGTGIFSVSAMAKAVVTRDLLKIKKGAKIW